MHSPVTMRGLAAGTLLLVATAAQFVQESISFGHLQSISSDGRTIPGWQFVGENHTPQLLSDRISLTPPVVGNTRGGLWADKDVTVSEWTLELDFRVSGPERGSGNMQVWLTKDASAASTMKSLYTVDKFDGLVIVLDQYQGTGGSIRGFLNDGSSSYRTNPNVDGLSFGHCEYVYRNLGRMSKLQMKQNNEGFEVKIDDRLCFKSDLIKIPSGYFFGISAASPEMPDSFEISKFVVSNPGSSSPNQGILSQTSDSPPALLPPIDNKPALAEEGKVEFSKGGSQDAQFYELLNRMQSATHSINNVYRELVAVEKRLHDRHDEQNNKNQPTFPQAQIDAMDQRILRIENLVQKIQNDVEGRDYKEHLTTLERSLQEARTTMLDNLPESISHIVKKSAPRMGLFIFVVLAFQVMLVGAYIVYKMRRANSPKKFL